MAEKVVYDDKVFELFVSEKEINAIVKKIARAINEYYKDISEEIVFISILDGSFVFMADLVRHVDQDIEIQFVKLKSMKTHHFILINALK